MGREIGKTKIHEILETPDVWIQGTLYKDENSRPCKKQQAIQACIYGLIRLCYDDEDFEYIRQRIASKVREDKLACWNDVPGRTQEEVRLLCKELDI